ncbi:Iron-sulfur cluster assembly scaffold protein IscU 2 [uncultured archaeon]|nr:Iron-sulfur cluster assembly scaffold protein IscU 2 [uncultured archaeon]
MDLYGNELIQRFKKPLYKYSGERGLKKISGSNESCGDQVNLFLLIKDNRIITARQECNGCLISNVSADFLCELLEEKTLEQASKIKDNDLLELFGINHYSERSKCVLLSLQVLKKNASLL